MAALNAAKFRRDRVESLAAATSSGAPLLATPQPGRGGSKRKTVPRKVDDTVGSTVSTTASTEKVTPDPKHIRTGGEAAPEPKQLFASPVEPVEPLPGGEPELVEGGVCVRDMFQLAAQLLCVQSFAVLMHHHDDIYISYLGT